MQDYPENLFASLKKGCFPGVDGEFERKLRVAFFYGMDAGHQLTMKSTELNNRTMTQFLEKFAAQIDESLHKVGMERCTVKLGKLGINGN